MTMFAEVMPEYTALHRLWWRLKMSETFLSRKDGEPQTKK